LIPPSYPIRPELIPPSYPIQPYLRERPDRPARMRRSGKAGCPSGGGRDSLRSSVIRDDQTVEEPEVPAEPLPFSTPASPVPEKPAELTPFMRQWTAAKRENPDALLFFRMGDFYELFYDDAVTASRELQLTLTARDRERRVPMCGVPYHSVESYLTRLLRRGFRIAICEQMEDPKLTKKIVKREVIRVLSPGTAMDTALGQEQNNFLAAYFEAGERHPAGARREHWWASKGSRG